MVFSYLNGDYLRSFEHEILFFGVEDLNPEFAAICRSRGLNYHFVKKEGAFFAFKLLGFLLRSDYQLIIDHSLPLIPILHYGRFLKNQPYVVVDHAMSESKRDVDERWLKLANVSAKQIIVLSDSSRKEIIDRTGIAPEKCVVIPNGLDLALYQKLAQNENEIRIITHGRLIPLKHIDMVIRAVFELKDEFPNLKVDIAGEGEEREKLLRLTSELGLNAQVEFYGLLSSKEIQELLSKADIYINSSSTENMSTALMQAMASSLTCLVSDIEANRNLIRNDVNGLHFKEGDESDLKEKLRTALLDKDKRLALGIEARKYADQNFGIDKLQRRYRQLTEEFIA